MVDPSKIISTLKENLENNTDVVTCVLVGSYAREATYSALKYSDMEIYIVAKDDKIEVVENYLPTLARKIGEYVFFYKNPVVGFCVVYEDLFRLELPLIKESDIAAVFSRPVAQTVKIIFDETAGELEKSLEARPKTKDFKTFFEQKIPDFWYMSTLSVQYLKKGEVWNSRSAMQTLQSSLIKLMELLNDPQILLLETHKRIEQFLLPEQIKILEKVSPAYSKEEIRDALENIFDAFSKVSKEVAEKYQYNYDLEIENKIKPKLLVLLNNEDEE